MAVVVNAAGDDWRPRMRRDGCLQESVLNVRHLALAGHPIG